MPCSHYSTVLVQLQKEPKPTDGVYIPAVATRASLDLYFILLPNNKRPKSCLIRPRSVSIITCNNCHSYAVFIRFHNQTLSDYPLKVVQSCMGYGSVCLCSHLSPDHTDPYGPIWHSLFAVVRTGYKANCIYSDSLSTQ